MSASNWAACPACKSRHDDRLEAAYGTMDRDDYAFLLQEAEANVGATFREDYEIYGASEGVVFVSYLGKCSECGTELRFQHSHAIDLPNEPLAATDSAT